jgi:hypothetical protein
MQIVTPLPVSLESLIDSTFADWNTKQELIILAKKEADTQAHSILKTQFQNNLNDVLTAEIQGFLNIEFSQSLTKGIFATFNYLSEKWYIYREFSSEGVYWNLANSSIDLICFPDSFQKQLLIELGKFKASIPTS